MADGCVITLPVPPEALARLKDAEARQRNETKRKKLPAEFVSVEGLWLIQRGLCGCLECAKGEAAKLNPEAVHGEPDHIVIMHLFPRGAKGGHTVANVRLGRADHNRASAHQEWSDIALGRRMAVNWSAKDEPLIETRESRSPAKWQSAGFRRDPKLVRGVNGKVRERDRK